MSIGGGALAAGVVLLATSAAAPAVGPPEAGVPRPAGEDRPATEEGSGSWIADRDDPLLAEPGAADDAGIVSTADDQGPGPMIPAVFTGDIPTTVLDAYRRARDATNLAQPGCHLPLELLEAIGKVETGHARGGQVDTGGNTLRPILGPPLDGNGFAAIGDTDGGALDGDTTWDRAVGPMQFIPGTWRRWGADGNGDRRADPHNVYDASLAAARYLCAANRDLGTPEGLDAAILSYNHSTSYRNLVLRWMATYAAGTVVVPDSAGLPVGTVPATIAPVTPSAPPATTAPPPVSSTPPAPTTLPVTHLPVTTTPVPSTSPDPSPDPTTTPASQPPSTAGSVPDPTAEPEPTATTGPTTTPSAPSTTEAVPPEPTGSTPPPGGE